MLILEDVKRISTTTIKCRCNKLLIKEMVIWKKINLICYDGSEGCEYEIYEDGEVSIYVISNGELESEVDVNLKSLGFSTIEELVIDLLNSGYNFYL